MKKRKLGRTDLLVSELNLNTDKFGWITDEAQSFALLDAYFTCGGSFIQTVGLAPNFMTRELTQNASEVIVGRWRQTRGISRDALAFASRLRFLRPPHGTGITFADHIREACECSLRRLRTTHLDLLICEWEEDLHAVDEVLDAVDRLIRTGSVRCAVAGGFPPWHLIDLLRRENVRNHARFEALQADYSLVNRNAFEPQARAICRDHQLGFLATSPLAGGLLTRRPNSSPASDHDWRNERFRSSAGDAALQALATIADKRLATPAQIALAWVLRDTHVTSAAISASNPRELRQLIRAADTLLSPEESGALTIEATNASAFELQHL